MSVFFRAQFKSVLIFRKIIECLKEFNTQCNFQISEDGIAVQSLDTSHVALTCLCLNADKFLSFAVEHPVVLGINLISLDKVLKCSSVSANEELIIYLKEEHDDSLHLQLIGPKVSADFDLRLMEIESDELTIPMYEHDVKIQMKSTDFQSIVHSIAALTDTISIMIDTTGMGIVFEGNSDAIAKTRICMKVDDDEEVKIVLKDSNTNILGRPISYALSYLNQFVKATSLTDTIILGLSQEMPLMVEYQLANDTGVLRFYLAPKTGDDQDSDEKQSEDTKTVS